MNTQNSRLLLGIVAGAFISTASADAASVKYSFGGMWEKVVDDGVGISPAVSVGTSFKGTLVFDDAAEPELGPIGDLFQTGQILDVETGGEFLSFATDLNEGFGRIGSNIDGYWQLDYKMGDERGGDLVRNGVVDNNFQTASFLMIVKYDGNGDVLPSDGYDPSNVWFQMALTFGRPIADGGVLGELGNMLRNGRLTRFERQIAPEVPLPAALPMLVTAIGFVGFLSRRKMIRR